MERRRPFDGDLLHARLWRPLPERFDPARQKRRRSLAQRLHRAIGRIAHPADHADGQRRLLGEIPIADSLNPASNCHMNRGVLCHGVPFSVPGRYSLRQWTVALVTFVLLFWPAAAEAKAK